MDARERSQHCSRDAGQRIAVAKGGKRKHYPIYRAIAGGTRLGLSCIGESSCQNQPVVVRRAAAFKVVGGVATGGARSSVLPAAGVGGPGDRVRSAGRCDLWLRPAGRPGDWQPDRRRGGASDRRVICDRSAGQEQNRRGTRCSVPNLQPEAPAALRPLGRKWLLADCTTIATCGNRQAEYSA